MKGGTEMKAPDFDDELQSSSGELPSPERSGKPLSVGDSAISPAIDGDGASSRLSLTWSRRSSLSSSQGSSSSDIAVDIMLDIELDNRYRHPQSELEEIPSQRWLSPILMPQLESEGLERVFFSDALRTAGNKYMAKKVVIRLRMTNDKMRRKAMRIAAGSDGVEEVSIEGDESDQLALIGGGIDSVETTTRVWGRVAFSLSTLKRLFNRLFNSGKPAADKIVVVGYGLDSSLLTTRLRKCMGFAELISVSPVKENKEQSKEEKEAIQMVQPVVLWPSYIGGYTPVSYYVYEARFYYQDPDCCIM